MLTRLSAAHPRQRGVTLIEVIAAIAILVVLATATVLSVEASSNVGGENERIDHAAFVLEKLRDAIARYNLGERGDTSFTWRISGLTNKRGGINPGALSQLTNQITSTSLNSCGLAYGATPPANWLRNFYSQPIATGGAFKIADGFIAKDQLVRYNVDGTLSTINSADVLTPGTLAIVMPNVAISDARALALRMEGDQSGGSMSVVRFTPAGDAPITVEYHMAIHGC
jgi:prepilin-type N-terminal cleavage/methylation domain-containing protein